MMKSACHYWEEKKMIPVFRTPYPDEHVLGWMIELANLNRMSIEKFLKWFMPSFKWEHSADTVANMFNIKYVNPLKIMRQNTLYFALFPFLTEGTQAKIVHRFLYGGDIHWFHTTTGLKYCPDCVKDDMNDGRLPYYRVWHQLDEVHTCCRHGCKLRVIPGLKLGMLDADETIDASEEVSAEGDDYSELIYKMYKNPIYTSIEKWGNKSIINFQASRISKKQGLEAAMKQLPVSEEGYKYLTEGNCQMCGKSFVAHPFVHETFGVCPECEKTLTKQQIINIRSKTQDEYEMDGRFVKHKKCGRRLSGGYHKFRWSRISCMCESLPTLQDYQEEFDDDEFKVTGFKTEKGKTTLSIKHKNCQKEFNICRTDFMTRRYCRVCESYENKFTQQFNSMVRDEYTLLSRPVSSVDYFEARHETCGFKFRMRARNFTEGQRCPFCQKNIGFEKVMGLLEENCNLTGYEIDDASPDIIVTLPSGEKKTMRCAWALQELTRYDEPEFFLRKNRIKPVISEKAKVFIYIRDHCDENGYFLSNKGYLKAGVTQGNFFTSVRYLKKSGHLEEVEKGKYRVLKRSDDS